MLLYVHRDHKDYQGRGAQDVHLGFHTVVFLVLKVLADSHSPGYQVGILTPVCECGCVRVGGGGGGNWGVADEKRTIDAVADERPQNGAVY